MTISITGYWEYDCFLYLSFLLLIWFGTYRFFLWRDDHKQRKQIHEHHATREEEWYLRGYDATPVRPNMRRA